MKIHSVLAFALVSAACASHPSGGHPIFASYVSVDLGAGGGGYVRSTDLPTHELATGGINDVHDGHGDGKRVAIDHVPANGPTLRQIVTMYGSGPWAFAELEVRSSGAAIATNWIGPLVVDERGTVTPGHGPDPRVLDVPVDHAVWVR